MKHGILSSGFKSERTVKLTRLMVALTLVYPVLSMAQSAQQTEEVVVTASRISREGFTAPTPTTIVGAEELKAKSAVSVADVLYDLPSNRPSTNTVGTSSVGQAVSNLRGLNGGGGVGNSRTLFMVDRHRYVPTNQFGQTDTNVIPTALVRSIETVTGGASAAWGSDAVAGVINISLKKKIEGFEGNIQYGQSQKNDAKTNQASLAWGTEFADGRGQFMVAGEYSRSYAAPTFADRDWSSKQTAFVIQKQVNGVPSSATTGVTNTYVPVSGLNYLNLAYGGGLILNSSTNAATNGTAVTSGALRGVQFDANGTPQPFIYNTDPTLAAGNVYGLPGTSGVWLSNKVNITFPTTRKNIYAHTTFDFTPNITGYFDAGHAESTNLVPSNPTISGNGNVNFVITRTNPFVAGLTGNLPNTTTTLAQYFAANPAVQNITLGRVIPDLGTYRTESVNKVDNFTGGLDGIFGDSGKWSAYAASGKSTIDVKAYDNIKLANFYAALNPTSSTQCNAALVASLYADPNCVPLNPFGTISQAAKDYVTGTYTQLITNKRISGGLTVQGEPFSNWAGPVSVAGGFDWRKDTFSWKANDYSDNIANGNPAGPDRSISLPYGFTSASGWAFIGAKTIPEISTITKEAFAETLVPLLSKVAFAKSLDLNAAVRRTDYSTSGLVTTWKGGLTWAPTSDVLFRGTRSRDIRAANFGELTNKGTTNANVSGTVGASGYDALSSPTFGTYGYAVINDGNINLKPEKADTITYGVSFTPSALKGFSASIDIWKIKLNNVVGQLPSASGGASSANTIIDACNGTQGFSASFASTYCSPFYIERDPTTNKILLVHNRYINVGLLKTNGLDFELAYRFGLNNVWQGAPGTMDVRLLGSYLDDFKTQASTLVNNAVETAGTTTNSPHWKATISATYQNGPLTFNLQGRYIGDQQYVAADTGPTFYGVSNNIPSSFTVNTSAQYTIYDKPGKGRLQVYGNINNLFDRDPPLVYGVGGQGPGAQFPTPTITAGLYDLIGRAFVLGLRFSY